MKCLICSSDTEHHFSKVYDKPPFDRMMRDIGKIDYRKCPKCGFTISQTHADMDTSVWEKLNNDFHHYLENSETEINQPPYLEQAVMLKVFAENGIIDTDSILDFAGGYGSLSKVLKKYFGIRLPVYDAYVHDGQQDFYVPRENLKTYKTVLNSALFEHLTTRDMFDSINDLVADDGCMIIHTVICENIPANPDWFYLEPPVHCAFHTNASMEMLIQQWGYVSSVYVPKAKCWVLFKKENVNLVETVMKINKEFQAEYAIYKKGFVDYWKGF
ncbi:methyltransferase domain-containing protein [Flavobacterium sp. MAH-1]|uniref:Methyltransferase domain-containing protein n=1 Tax=Flavobacterium agri TaxID=2743471 RepID=A0A7Y8Y4N6_9FLAO|nr:methyltransferase domain-containing protein [Flavobacterium agri]NUY82298.1 methyltransferase domain-containing protein [Flavobacterium agri]NYA72322.1 methyltransferase domain-containing protein [Flavobacterium agri]